MWASSRLRRRIETLEGEQAALHARLADPETAFGVHIGANLYSKELKRLKSDLQVSLNLSGMPMGTGRILSVNALYGGRYYIINPENNVSYRFKITKGF